MEESTDINMIQQELKRSVAVFREVNAEVTDDEAPVIANADAEELTPTILGTPDDSQNHFSISAEEHSQGEVIVTCRGLGGNLPKEYKNNLALWRSSIPNMADGPLETVPMPDNNQPNRVLFEYNFEPTDYSLTYQVGSEPSTMCAMTSLLLFPEAVSAVPTNVSLVITKATTESIEVQYTVLPGYQPMKYHNRIGIWGGYMIPYNSPLPLGRSKIGDSQFVTLNQLNLRKGGRYTLIYFMQDAEQDSKRSTAGALLYFSL
jgi:hypothetical protein